MLWVYGGSIARFYQGYRRIAELLEIPGWDDLAAIIVELVRSWLSKTSHDYLLVIDNADNIEHWFPRKYKSGGPLDDPLNNLSKFLPQGAENGQVLITTRDDRVADRLTEEKQPISLQPMSDQEGQSLFVSRIGEKELDVSEANIRDLVRELDHLPLAISQAAAFIKKDPVSIADYMEALRKEGAEEDEYLHEELYDSRRDEESVNCVFRTWKISHDEIKRLKPRAAELLSLLSMFDRQSIPKSLLKMPEVTTSLALLQSFNLVSARAGSRSYQLHRLVQRFMRISLQRENEIQKWQEKALACISRDYPTEIGVAEWPVCDALAPHVHTVTGYRYETIEAQLDLAHLLCWAADFDIERGMYVQALTRARRSLSIFQQLVSARDQRLAAATWLYGRLCYYEAKSTSDMDAAADLLRNAFSISTYPSLNFAESAFELAHLYYDQCKAETCLEMGKASFECWEEMEGLSSVRTLDNMHDYALELALLGHERAGIAKWQDIVKRTPSSDASENTKTVYTYRSLAGIAEFQGEAAMAEFFYAQLIVLCEALYNSEHIHVYDYRLSHAEQIMRQGKLEEARNLSEAILESCTNTSEWRITASCLQTIAECYRLEGCYDLELPYRQRTLNLHEGKLGQHHKETVNAVEAMADCYLQSSQHTEARTLLAGILSWRRQNLGQSHADTVRAMECLGILRARQGQDAEAETIYLEMIHQKDATDARLLDKLCKSLWNRSKWKDLEG